MVDTFADAENRQASPVERTHREQIYNRTAFAIIQGEAILLACFVGLYFESWWSFLGVLLLGLALIWIPAAQRYAAIVFGLAAGVLAFAMAFRTWSFGWSALAAVVVGGVVTAINLAGVRHPADVSAFKTYLEHDHQRTGSHQ